MNRYAYVEGNPVTKVDPSGYSSQPGSVGAKLSSVGYKNRVLTAEFAKGMENSGFIFNMDRRLILGVQFTTAHRICDVGGLIPVIGFGFDIGNTILYDLEGYKLKSAASIAGAGLNLFGSGLLAKGSMSSLDNFAEAGVKYSDDAIEAGVKSGRKSYKISRITTAEKTNQWFVDNVKPDYKPPYKLETLVKEIELTEKTTFVRVYDNMPNGSGMYGSWVMRADDIKGLTPLEIQDKFALPNVPKYVCDVELDAGTHIRVGEVNPLSGWGKGGGTQYDLIGQRIGIFKNERILKGK